MTQSIFVYETYIRSTPDKLWQALTTSELLKRCWMGASIESDWKVGSHWRATSPEGSVFDSGEILESVPQRRLVMNWRNEWKPEFKAEGDSHCIYEIEPLGMAVKFTITHSIERPDSKFIASVAPAWPMVMSNLKSLLETGGVTLVENPRHAH
jgi:uncharacterized protein YndB with AHSA1/START domain